MLFAAVLLIAAPAVSFVPATDPVTGVLPRWPDGRAVMHHDPDTMTSGFVDAFRSAMQRWSQVSGSDFRFIHGGASKAKNVRSSNNGSSDFYFDATLMQYAFAITIMNYDGTDRVTERDVAFNSNESLVPPIEWTTIPQNRAGGPVDFETVAVHELGHVLGLLHQTKDQANVDSVMNTIHQPRNPVFADRSLFADDRKAVRALYPEAPPSGPDLVVEEVTFAAGEVIRVRFTVTNIGDESSGSFGAAAGLGGGAVPAMDDLPIGETGANLFLDPGESRSVTIDGRLPPDMPPGEYRVGVTVDAERRTPDVNRTNNVRSSAETLPVSRDPLDVTPGMRIDESIGPFGTDVIRVELLGGTTVSFRGRMGKGTAALLLIAPDGSTVVASSKVARKPKIQVGVPADGAYTVQFASGYSGITDYRVKTKAKKTRGTIDLAAAGTVTIPAYEGAEVKIRVTGAFATVEGITPPTKTRGSRAVLGPFPAPTTGLLKVTTTAAARVRWSVRKL
jgi:hypothetical protein